MTGTILDRALKLVRLSATEFLMSAVAILGVAVVAVVVAAWAMEPSRMANAQAEFQPVREQIMRQMAANTGATGEVAPATPAPQATNIGADGFAEAHALFRSKGCIACHMAPGIPEAVGTIGPDLEGLASRAMIADVMELTEENLAKWIHDPQAMKPDTVMLNVGLSDPEVETLVTWLLSLE